MRIRLPETPPDFSPKRLEWDLHHFAGDPQRFEGYWEKRRDVFDPQYFDHSEVFLEVGAGTGAFLLSLAKENPNAFCIGIERSRHRGKKLEEKTKKSQLPNVVGHRGNAIPAIIHELPNKSLDRIYQMYPCPWPKRNQRRNRWYIHPIMPHMLRALKPEGILVWTSDQKFYIDEAHWICKNKFDMEVLHYGELKPNPYNLLDQYPEGRSAFEKHFFEQKSPCYELIVCKR